MGWVVLYEPLGLYDRGGMEEHQERLGMFSSHTRFEVRDGAKVRFWHDMWCGDKALGKPFQIYMVLFAQRML
jgi:hypothetical protein